MKALTALLFASLLVGCSAANENSTTKWGTGEDSDLPALFESVCLDDAHKCGGTHLDDFGPHISVTFTRFETKAEADIEFQQERERSTSVLSCGIIRDRSGEPVGEKCLVLIDAKLTSGEPDRQYSLIWTRGDRFAQLWSESLEAIQKYEIDRRL